MKFNHIALIICLLILSVNSNYSNSISNSINLNIDKNNILTTQISSGDSIDILKSYVNVISSISADEIGQKNDDTDCINNTLKLQQYIQSKGEIRLPNDKQYYNKIIIYSGRTLNDVGNYDACTNTQETKFISISTATGGAVIRVGLCYFKSCSNKYLNSFKPLLVDYILKNYGLKLDPKILVILDVEEYSDNLKSDYKISFIITLIVIFLVVSIYILNFISSLLKPKGGKAFAYNPSDLSYAAVSDKSATLLPGTGIKNNMETSEITDVTDVKPNTQENSGNVSKSNQTTSIDVSIDGTKKKSSPLKWLLSHFNVFEHLSKIMSVKAKPDEPLRIFDGIRFFSACWVVFGHTMMGFQSSGFYNMFDVGKFFVSAMNGFIYAGFYSVDVFFYMSAFMLYIGMQKFFNSSKKMSSIKTVGFAILARYIRLFPLVFFVIILFPSIIANAATGNLPMFSDGLFSSCNKYFWHNFLYINNLINYKSFGITQGCADHTWYLADDMQFFIVFFSIFVFLRNRKTIRNLIILSIMVIAMVISYVLCIINEYYYYDNVHNRPVHPDFFNVYYVRPYIRVAPYIIGLFMCEFYLECKANPKYKENEDIKDDNIMRRINKYIVKSTYASYFILLGALILINVAFFSTYFTNEWDIPLGVQGLMYAMNKVLFVFGLGVIVQLVFLGKFQIIHRILSLDFFNVMSKLTFGIYLVHLYFVYLIIPSINNVSNFEFYTLSVFVAGILVISTITSLIISLLFESPVISMMKQLLGKNE